MLKKQQASLECRRRIKSAATLFSNALFCAAVRGSCVCAGRADVVDQPKDEVSVL
jgi:hypothetical protein